MYKDYHKLRNITGLSIRSAFIESRIFLSDHSYFPFIDIFIFENDYVSIKCCCSIINNIRIRIVGN